MIEFTEQSGGIAFAVRVTPRSSRNSIDGERDGALKIRLTAPPVDSRANDALRKFLAAVLHVPPSSVAILSGEKSRTKRVRIAGITRAHATTLLQSTA